MYFYSWYNNTVSKKVRKTGAAIPLGALRTKDSPFIGEFDSLVTFAKFCKKSGLKLIQLLPVLDTGTQSSPYSSLSAYALHPIYINLSKIDGFEQLCKEDAEYRALYSELLAHKDDKRFDYSFINSQKSILLWKLYKTLDFENTYLKDKGFNKWLKENSWVKNYSIYKCLKYKYMQATWKAWPEADRNVTQQTIARYWQDSQMKKGINFYLWSQYTAHTQFINACNLVKAEGITLKGDLPILINEDSCDAWSNAYIFDTKLRAGSPPDGENPYGQNWGFPIYDWQAQKKDNFQWWRNRLKCASQYYDAYRLDHILGFFRIWATPEGEETAELGHPEPYTAIPLNTLIKNGFSKERIKWLSLPHIPTKAIQDITQNYEAACAILSVFCNRIPNEELWLFKDNIASEYSIRQQFFNYTPENEPVIIDSLVWWWKNRTLIPIAKDRYIQNWKYNQSQSWQSLSEDEKQLLQKIFEDTGKKQEKLWKSNAEEIFASLIPSTHMTPCAEDLGVSLGCMDSVLKKFDIMSLNVIRWSRQWSEKDQPYIPFSKHKENCVATTSVHDSTTLRQWWQNEKQSVEQFIEASSSKDCKINTSVVNCDFNQDIAFEVLKQCAKTKSAWLINPLQDWLYLENKYYDNNPDEERINVPGSVNEFNWTFRIGYNIEQMIEDEKLIKKISSIVKIHD